MKYHASSIIAILALSVDLTIAVPVENLQAIYPSSINCGTNNGGLANVSPPDYEDLRKGATRLSDKGGTCSTPAGSGKCIRVACDNTTGIWMCNTDGHDGPYSAACTDVAAFVYRGEDDGSQTRDIWMTCRNAGLYSVSSVSGQAFDESGNWNIITGYANCRHPASNPPDAE